MEQADYVRLVRLSEQASAEDSAAYRRSVAAFAALGYAWVVGCLLLAGGTLAWVGMQVARGEFKGFFVWGVLAAVAILWASSRALWCRLQEPQGLRLTAAQAPALFEALERIRRKVKGPALDAVYVDGDFNASISQHPRFGLFGGTRNYLTVGLPLMMAVDRPRLLAVLAHEYGHLRGDHGRFAAWIYRTRQSWASFHESLRGDDGPIASATRAFLEWYFPRFTARTFALARQDEYEADRIAARLLGRDVAGAALVEIDIKSDWLHQRFWPEHWTGAAHQPLPQGPYAPMAKLLALPPEPAFAAASLRGAMRRIAGLDDTHPALRDRLEALGAAPGLPSFSTRPAIELLGAVAQRCIAHFDRQWCRDSAGAWKDHHAYLGRVKARCARLEGNVPQAPAELVELAGLQRRLGQAARARACYERALTQAPEHAPAWRGLAQLLPKTEAARRLACLEHLFEISAADRWWASRNAVAQLEEEPHSDATQAALKTWRERLKTASAAEERAGAELAGDPLEAPLAAHGLGEFELGEVAHELRRWSVVERAWLLRKPLKEFPHRRCYLVLVLARGLEDDEAADLCGQLDRALELPGSLRTVALNDVAGLPREAGGPVFERGQ